MFEEIIDEVRIQPVPYAIPPELLIPELEHGEEK
jgi:hypothetical protein